MIFNSVTVIWLGVLVVMLVAEGATAGLVSIWFAAGALGALIVQVLGGWLWLQILVFLLVSLAALLLLRPMAQRMLQKDRQATNADRVYEMVGVVETDVDNVAGTGTVKLDGKVWTARSLTGAPIPAGTLVRAKMIEGVKLIVCPAGETPPPDGAVEEKH